MFIWQNYQCRVDKMTWHLNKQTRLSWKVNFSERFQKSFQLQSDFVSQSVGAMNFSNEDATHGLYYKHITIVIDAASVISK
jgi:hypothetical protein